MNWGLYLHMARRWVVFAILPTIVVAALAYLRVNHEL
jgi:hypothetical protein